MKSVGSHLASYLQGRKSGLRPARPFIQYVILLVAIILLYGWLFHVIMEWEGQEHSWFTGIYWTLTVMSTLGFGDITFTSDLGRVFSTAVLLTGIVLLLVILPFLFIRLVYAPWLEEQSRRRFKALRSVPKDTRDHVIICANDPIALGLVQRLRLAGVRSWVIEPDGELAGRMSDAGFPVLTGDIDAVETYAGARVETARLVLANAADTVNTNIVLTVRELSPTVPIAAIVEYEDSVDILELSGATYVFPLKQRLGEQLASRVSAGNARANVIGRFHHLLLAEFPVHNTPLQNKTVRETRLREATGVSIVGVWEHGRLLPAHPELQLSPLSVPVVVGTEEQIRGLDELLVIYDANPNPVLVIGGGKVGRAAARALKARGLAVHVVERNGALEPKVAGIPDKVFIGDAADREVLAAAGVEQAPSILLTTHDDAMNIYLTVYCRRLNPDARILTRVTHERNVEAIQRAGADFVLSYAALGVQTVFAAVQGRELVVLGEGVDLFYIPVPQGLAGQSLAQTGIGAKTGLNVIAVQADGKIEMHPQPGEPLREGSVLVALGSAQQRQAFEELFVKN
ncbi:MAG: potassium transporter TrkA [Gemmatimonadales bacterium]|nr:Voltage-gated potassium channel Kch [bacterium HR33]GIW52478.1 MAG: potassium transporter TrkA [Gemmatimonadales bacterium]